MRRLLRDTWLSFDRAAWIALHNPIWIVLGLGQPIVYLLFFGPLLKPIASVRDFPVGGAYNVFVPGLLVQLGMLGLFNGFSLLAEVRYGVIERFRVTPMSRLAMLLGRALRDVAIIVVQALLMILVALPFGLTITPAAAVAVLFLMALTGLVTAPFSYAVALWLRNEDALAPFVNAIALPLFLLSGILLPLSLAPEWLRVVAAFNPFSYAVAAARDLFIGRGDAPEVATAVALMAALAGLSLWFAARAFDRSVS